MYRSDFKFEDNMEELEGFILDKTTDKIRELQKTFNKEVFNVVCDDIETWLYERFDNVRRQYFDSVVAFLLDQEYTHVDKKETLNQWLSGIGYTQESFRKKIYNDNKIEINKAITYDAVYDALQNIFDHSYFKHWDFNDITKGYPQTTLIKEFMFQLIKQDGFNTEIKKMLDTETNYKLNELKRLKEELSEIQSKIDNIKVSL